MKLFTVEIQNSGNDQVFMVEADDLISAHMKGIEFAKELDKHILKTFGVEDVSTVIGVSMWNALFCNEEGIAEYLDMNRVYFEVEE